MQVRSISKLWLVRVYTDRDYAGRSCDDERCQHEASQAFTAQAGLLDFVLFAGQSGRWFSVKVSFHVLVNGMCEDPHQTKSYANRLVSGTRIPRRSSTPHFERFLLQVRQVQRVLAEAEQVRARYSRFRWAEGGLRQVWVLTRR